MDLVPVTSSSADDLLASFHELAVAAEREWLPEVDPPGPMETRSQLDDDFHARRGGILAFDGSKAVGAACWDAPRHEDRDLISGWVTVDRAYRRRGIGRELFSAVADVVRPDGRCRWVDAVREGSAAEAFASALGASVGLVSVSSVAHLPSIDPADTDALAEEVPAGYHLVQWNGLCPDDLVDAFAVGRAAMNDAPIGDLGLEDVTWTAERVLALDEQRAKWGMRVYTTAAVHGASGEVAGFTDIVVADRPTTALQEDTGVVAAHRGHGLGLVMKALNQQWLRAAEPQITDIITWNAEGNRYMRSVNERLGYRPIARWLELTLKL